jgi:hypothetical protein
VRVTPSVCAVVLALAVAAAPAHADRWKSSDVQLAMRVADAHWPASACFQAHVIQWLRGWELDELFQQQGETGATGIGEVGGCRVWIAWDRIDPSPAWLCTILEHEFGHNAGAEHSSDPHDVMNPWQASVAADCGRAFARRSKGRTRRHR